MTTYETISVLQSFANIMGYDAGPIDGIDGPKTSAALLELAADNPVIANKSFGFDENGKYENIGIHGALIEQLQTDSGFRDDMTARMHDILENGTREEIKAVQTLINTGLPENMQLAVDGLVGPKTMAAFEGFEGATIENATDLTLSGQFNGVKGKLHSLQSEAHHNTFGLDDSTQTPYVVGAFTPMS